MSVMFDFDPNRYAASFAKEGFIHIRKGLKDAFLKKLIGQVETFFATSRLKDFTIGDKQQALYEFPKDGEYVGELIEAIAKVTGLDQSKVVLSERHFKSYEPIANPEPNAHKDRYASQISVGFSVINPTGSTLVLYPYDHLEVNPFNSSVALRASMSPDQFPEAALRKTKRVEIHDEPGDVIVFRGHSIWHLREKPAGTTMLYLKLNARNCDPLGEDPQTPDMRKRTQTLLTYSDAELEKMIPVIGRRVDYIHRHYSRDWQEVPGVVLWGEKHFSIDEQELRGLREMNGFQTVRSVVEKMNSGLERSVALGKIRRLAARGVIDLLPAND